MTNQPAPAKGRQAIGNMKNIIILVCGLLSQALSMAQGTIDFDIDFGANPPPHTTGAPDSGATLTASVFYAAIYLDTTEPLSAAIGLLEDGVFTPVLEFGYPVYASYPDGATALDYEGSWQLTTAQIDNLMAGQWYAEVNYSNESFTGEITAVPEPSSMASILAGGALFGIVRWRRMAPLRTRVFPPDR
jgi:hypothetical protein